MRADGAPRLVAALLVMFGVVVGGLWGVSELAAMLEPDQDPWRVDLSSIPDERLEQELQARRELRQEMAIENAKSPVSKPGKPDGPARGERIR